MIQLHFVNHLATLLARQNLRHLFRNRLETRALVQAVKRNQERFPTDFLFQITNQELAVLKSQSVISSAAWGGRRRSLPYAFTEYGVANHLHLNQSRLASANARTNRKGFEVRSFRSWNISGQSLALAG